MRKMKIKHMILSNSNNSSKAYKHTTCKWLSIMAAILLIVMIPLSSYAESERYIAVASDRHGNKVSGKARFTVNKKTGKIKIKKGTKKGTYKVKVRVTAAGTDTYQPGSKTATVKIKVK